MHTLGLSINKYNVKYTVFCRRAIKNHVQYAVFYTRALKYHVKYFTFGALNAIGCKKRPFGLVKTSKIYQIPRKIRGIL